MTMKNRSGRSGVNRFLYIYFFSGSGIDRRAIGTLSKWHLSPPSARPSLSLFPRNNPVQLQYFSSFSSFKDLCCDLGVRPIWFCLFYFFSSGAG